MSDIKNLGNCILDIRCQKILYGVTNTYRYHVSPHPHTLLLKHNNDQATVAWFTSTRETCSQVFETDMYHLYRNALDL